jgi:ribonuclease HI
MIIEVYSDGSAQTKDKPGGWASVILIDGQVHLELAGHLEQATNNDSELIAAIKGLDYVLEYLASFQGSFPLEVEVTLLSDSQIVLNWANGTYRFKQADKLPLYDHLRRLVKKLSVKTQWIRGHSGNTWNERCDKLANDARKGIPIKSLDKSTPKTDTRIGTKKTGVVSLWYSGLLKIIDFENGIIENYDREVHGKRGSTIEIREDKLR